MTKISDILRRLRARLASGQGGFTLPELLIAIVVGSTVVTALSAAFLVTTKTTIAAKSRLDESHDTQQAAAFFTADAANASYFSTVTPPVSATGTCDPFSGAGEARVGMFQWADSGVTKAAMYGTTGSPATLVRRYCENGVKINDSKITRNIGASSPVVTCPASPCSANSTYLELNVTETSGFDYTLRADPRTTGSGATGLLGGIAVYVGSGGVELSGNMAKITIPNGSLAISDGSTVCNGGSSFSPSGALYSDTTGGCNPLNGTPPPDPLGGIPEPSVPATAASTSTTTLCDSSMTTYQPGLYSSTGNISISNACLASGIYYFDTADNRGVSLTNVKSASGGVLIYVKDGYLDLSSASLSAMSTGDQAGVAIFMARSNDCSCGNGTNNQAGQVRTNDTMTFNGVVYAPNGKLDVQSNGATVTATGLNTKYLQVRAGAGFVVSPT